MSDKTRTIELPNRRELLKFLPPGGLCVEVGVDRGQFSQTIFNTCKPDKLYLVDNYDNPPDRSHGTEAAKAEALSRMGDNPRVQFIFDRSVAAAAQFADNTFDWVYIDANHQYASVMADMVAWWPKVKMLGYMLGHDYLTRPPEFEVERAVNDFVERRGLRLAVVTTDEVWKNWAIQKPSLL